MNHTIIVCGDSFRDIYKSRDNWHLRNDYGIQKFVPSVILSNYAAVFSAINANLGIGPSFCYQSQHLRRVLPWISGPVAMLDFAIRTDISDKLQQCIEGFNQLIQQKLCSRGIELMHWGKD
jgi:hypothetical protein